MMSIDEFEAALSASTKTLVPRLGVVLEEIGEVAKMRARDIPGEYQPNWPHLADATIEDKEKKGFPIPSPLKRTGEMAETYDKEVDVPLLMLTVGSPDIKARWQEVGTPNIPPRGVCEPALVQTLPLAWKKLGEVAVSILTGKP